MTTFDEIFDEMMYDMAPYEDVYYEPHVTKLCSATVEWMCKKNGYTLPELLEYIQDNKDIRTQICSMYACDNMCEDIPEFLCDEIDRSTIIRNIALFPWVLYCRSVTDTTYIMSGYRYYYKMATYYMGEQYKTIEKNEAYNALLSKSINNVLNHDPNWKDLVGKHPFFKGLRCNFQNN